MMNKPLFSIIVPVYNVEKYILQCITSILSQSFGDFELLVVDDGSPDSSISLINSRFEDDRIKVLKKGNGGLSDARNFGLRHAVGEYVWFVDSDDYINDPDALLKLQKTIIQYNRSIEVIVFNIDVVFENTTRENMEIVNAPENSEVFSGYDYIERYNIFPYNAWTQCYKKSFLTDNNFLFPFDLLFEDIYLNLDIYKKAQSIVGINETFYTYYRRANSITGSQTNEKHLLSQAKVLAKIYRSYHSEALPVTYLSERIQIEYDRTKSYYKASYKNLDAELSDILKDIRIPPVKSETISKKIEKKIFSYFPLILLKNQVFFRKLGSMEKRIFNSRR